ncbi:MAG: AzlD domain-containing protein [Anaerolineae bacterium]|nr:AzlD domain-containing protein [Anaerolineae bacterium]
MTTWLTILGMVAVTYTIRLSVIALLGETTLSPAVHSALRYVPPAALSAIVFPAVFMPNGSLDLSLNNTHLIAGAVAALVAWRVRSTLLSIAVGMVALWVLGGGA